jgi:ribonuclease VapC
VIVLDSSAVLASFFGEPGFERVDDALPEAMISVVNAIEVLTRLARDDHDIDRMAARLRATGVSFEPLDWEQVLIASALDRSGRAHGLSLGDRCCLALAMVHALPVLTADRVWAQLDLGIEVELLR